MFSLEFWYFFFFFVRNVSRIYFFFFFFFLRIQLYIPTYSNQAEIFNGSMKTFVQ